MKMNDSNVETFEQLDMLDNAIVRLKHSICDIEDLKKTGTTKTKSILKDFDEYHFLDIKDWCDTIDEEIQWYKWNYDYEKWEMCKRPNKCDYYHFA